MHRFVSWCFSFGVLSFAIWAPLVASQSNNCADLIFLDREIDLFHATSNHNTTITFAVSWTSCSSDTPHLMLTVAKKEDNLLSTECKLILRQTSCRASSATSACSCVSEAGPVTFFKNFSRPGNVTYEWSWQYQGSYEKKTAITFMVSGKFLFYRQTAEESNTNVKKHTNIQPTKRAVSATVSPTTTPVGCEELSKSKMLVFVLRLHLSISVFVRP